MGGSPSFQVTIKFGGHRHCDSGNNKIPVKFGISVTVYARLLPLLLFSVKHMACHMPRSSRIKT